MVDFLFICFCKLFFCNHGYFIFCWIMNKLGNLRVLVPSIIMRRQFAPSLWWTMLATSRTFAWTSPAPRAFPRPFPATATRPLFSSPPANTNEGDIFQPGAKVQIEVLSFGPLGASVNVIGKGHDQGDLLAEDAEPFGTGLILQKEIGYFRQARDNIDVVSLKTCCWKIHVLTRSGLQNIVSSPPSPFNNLEVFFKKNRHRMEIACHCGYGPLQ
jgi:hypothetical protein